MIDDQDLDQICTSSKKWMPRQLGVNIISGQPLHVLHVYFKQVLPTQFQWILYFRSKKNLTL